MRRGITKNFTRNLGKVYRQWIIITTVQRAEFVIIALMNKEGISSRKGTFIEKIRGNDPSCMVDSTSK